MWTGLIRRFSTEDSFPSQADTAYEENNGLHKDGINGVFNPKRRTASPFRPPPLDPLILHGYRESTPDSAKLLTGAVAEEIRTMIPERLRIVDDWYLIYSLEQDGASLTTLYQRCRQYEGKRAGFVLVVKDQDGGVSYPPKDLMLQLSFVRLTGNRPSVHTYPNIHTLRTHTLATANVSYGEPLHLHHFHFHLRLTPPT